MSDKIKPGWYIVDNNNDNKVKNGSLRRLEGMNLVHADQERNLRSAVWREIKPIRKVEGVNE